MNKFKRIIGARGLAILAGVAVSLSGIFASPAAVAAPGNYPDRAVTIIVPFSAGGFSDILARQLSQRLSDMWKVPVIIDNVVGAGGNLGGLKASRASPDGYTLLLSNTATNAINKFIFKKMEFDPVQAFDPVVLVVKTPNAVIVNKNLGVSSLGELVALLKSKPGELNFGSSGTGTTAQLTGEIFQAATGTKIVHVPYKGSSPVMAALQANSVQVTFDNSVSWAPLIASGQVRALAIASSRRSALMPDVPTAEEAGVRNMEATSWFGISAPRGTPADIISKLNQDINTVIQSPEFIERMKGGEIIGGTPGQYAAFMTAESEKWGRAVKQAGIEEQ